MNATGNSGETEITTLVLRAINADDSTSSTQAITSLKNKIAATKNPQGVMLPLLKDILAHEDFPDDAPLDLEAMNGGDSAEIRTKIARALRLVATISEIPDLIQKTENTEPSFAAQAAYYARNVLLQTVYSIWDDDLFRWQYPQAAKDIVTILAQTSVMDPSVAQKNMDVLLASYEMCQTQANESEDNKRDELSWHTFAQNIAQQMCIEAPRLQDGLKPSETRDTLGDLKDFVAKIACLDGAHGQAEILSAPNPEMASHGLRGLLGMWKAGRPVDPSCAMGIIKALESSIQDEHFNANKITHPVLIESCAFLAQQDNDTARYADTLLQNLLKMPQIGAYASECTNILHAHARTRANAAFSQMTKKDGPQGFDIK